MGLYVFIPLLLVYGNKPHETLDLKKANFDIQSIANVIKYIYNNLYSYV